MKLHRAGTLASLDRFPVVFFVVMEVVPPVDSGLPPVEPGLVSMMTGGELSEGVFSVGRAKRVKVRAGVGLAVALRDDGRARFVGDLGASDRFGSFGRGFVRPG